jgi:hypothetical protein
MNRIKLTVSALFICTVLFAQPSDDAFWGGITARVQVNKKLRISLEEQIRFNENYSNLNTMLSEAGVSYDLTKNITARSTFRYYYMPSSHNRFRYTADLSYSWSKKKFPLRFKYRVRFQNTIRQYTNASSSYIRNKFTVEYNLSKLADPYISYEPYFKLNYVNKFTVNRYYIGMDWTLRKDLALDTFFMIESEYGERNPDITRVIGLGLTYKFKI